MNDPHTALELQPLVEKLAPEEQVRLAKQRFDSLLKRVMRRRTLSPHLANQNS